MIFSLSDGRTWEGLPPSPSLGEPQNSHAFVCPVCGVRWASAAVPSTLWAFWVVSCPKCPEVNGLLPGSLWLPWEKALLAALPRDLLLREFDLHLKAQEIPFTRTVIYQQLTPISLKRKPLK